MRCAASRAAARTPRRLRAGRALGAELARHALQRPAQVHRRRPGAREPRADPLQRRPELRVRRAAELERDAHRGGHADRGRAAHGHVLDRARDRLAVGEPQVQLLDGQAPLVEQLHGVREQAHREEAHCSFFLLPLLLAAAEQAVEHALDRLARAGAELLVELLQDLVVAQVGGRQRGERLLVQLHARRVVGAADVRDRDRALLCAAGARELRVGALGDHDLARQVERAVDEADRAVQVRRRVLVGELEVVGLHAPVGDRVVAVR